MSTTDPTSRKFTFDSITNIVPFTARAGDTYLTILEKMAAYLSNLAENVNTSLDESAAAVTEAITSLQGYVNTSVADLTQYVDSEIENSQQLVDTKIVELVDYVNEEVSKIVISASEIEAYRDEAIQARNQAEAFATDVEEFQDSAMTQIASNPGSEFSLLLSAKSMQAVQDNQLPQLLVADKTRLLVTGSSSEWGLAVHARTILRDEYEWPLEVVNQALGGQMFEHIAAQQGIVPALLTFPGNAIPASGDTPVTTSLPADYGMKPFTGIVNGVHGTLSRAGSGHYVWTRSTPGVQVATTPNAVFMPDAEDASNAVHYRDCAMVLSLAKNSVGRARLDTLQAWVDAQIEWQLAQHGFALITGMFANTGTPAASKAHVAAMNSYASTVAASNDRVWFMDVGGYLSSAQVWEDTGITPTSADLALQAAGELPTSLSADVQHMNVAAYAAVIRNVWAPAVGEALGYSIPDIESDLLAKFDPAPLSDTIADGESVTNLPSTGGTLTVSLNTPGGASQSPRLKHGELNGNAVLEFTGDGSLRNSVNMGIAGAVTTAVLFNKTSTGNGFIFASTPSSGQRMVLRDQGVSTLSGTFGEADATPSIVSGFESSMAGWVAAFLVCDGSNSRLVAATSSGIVADVPGVFDVATNANVLRLGASSSGSDRFIGQIAQVKMWGRAFTVSDCLLQYSEWATMYELV